MQLSENVSEDPSGRARLRPSRGQRARLGRSLALPEPRPTGASPYRSLAPPELRLSYFCRRIALYAFMVSVIANSTGSLSILDAP
jgi:hypothetical protein